MKYRSSAVFLASLFMCGCSNTVDYQSNTVSSETALRNNSSTDFVCSQNVTEEHSMENHSDTNCSLNMQTDEIQSNADSALDDYPNQQHNDTIEEIHNKLSGDIQYISLNNPKDLSESYIESLQQLKEISILLTEDCDIPFLGTLNNLEQLTIDNGESLAGDFPQRSSYASSYDFLQTMNGLSTLSVSNVKDFPIELCCMNPSIQKMWFYACSFDTSLEMSNSVKELKLFSCDFDMNNILSSFPELSSLEIRGGTNDLSMIGNLTELTELILEMPDINGIESISECGELCSLVILARQGNKATELSDVGFISSLKKLNNLTLYAGTLSDKQKQFINANLPECVIIEYDTP